MQNNLGCPYCLPTADIEYVHSGQKISPIQLASTKQMAKQIISDPMISIKDD